jgi:cytochrome P450
MSGYDTTGQTLAYAAYQLAKNPEIQKRLQEEVDLAFDESNGEDPDYAVVQVSFNLKLFTYFDAEFLTKMLLFVYIYFMKMIF